MTGLLSGYSSGDSDLNPTEEVFFLFFFSFTYLSLAAATRWKINVHVLFTSELVPP